MTSELAEHAIEDNLDAGYEFFHPVDVYGYWVYKFFEIAGRPEFLYSTKVYKSNTNENQIIRADESSSEYSWSNERVKALTICENTHESTININRWLKFGLTERAGRLETELRVVLSELTSILKCSTEAKKFQTNNEHFLDCLSSLTELNREISHTAINPDDGALDEWFSVLESMRSALGEVLSSHSYLHCIIIDDKHGRIGNQMYQYRVAGSDFESLLPQVRSQIRRGYRGEQEFERADRLPKLFAYARWSFEEILTKNKLPPDSYPADIHQLIRREASYFHRKLELTLADRPKANQPRILWDLGIAHSPAQRPSWDKNLRELRFGGELCKRFNTKAKNQEIVLDTFQLENWPVRIDDPLPPGKLHETVHQLTKTNKFIKFTSDGHGEGIRWELKPLPK